MHSSLGFMVNNHPTLRAEPKEKGVYCIDNRDSILSMVIVNPRLYYHVLCGKSSLVVISNLQYSLHCKQGSYRKHHNTTSCGIHETESTTSCQYMENNTLPVTTKTRVEWEM